MSDQQTQTSEPSDCAEEDSGRRRRRGRRRRPQRSSSSSLSDDPQINLAIYIAMAHAGLGLSLAFLYGLAMLLRDYRRPILWAILFSMPLRELQTALVSFWSHSLNLGLFETLIAIPVAALRVTTASVIDSHAALLRLLRHPAGVHRHGNVGFSKLMQWLVSFGLFVIVYERIGVAAIPAFTVPCLFARSIFGRRSSFAGHGIASTLTSIYSLRRSSHRFVHDDSFFSRISLYITSRMLSRLKTVVGIGLIAFMIVMSLFGIVFFSYKIAIEGKDAVVSLKVHLDENDYAERIGMKKWMDDNQVPELIDAYTAKFYETVSTNMDAFASHYNVTEIVDGLRHYLSKSMLTNANSSLPGIAQGPLQSMSEKLHYIRSRVGKREWRVIYRDAHCMFKKFISVISRRELIEKFKALVLESLDASKKVLSGGTMVLIGSTNVLFSAAMSILSGAAELLNFISETTLFFCLLHYLITSDSGGVMDHVLGMLPLSKSTRDQCAQVLDHAVSSVLLAAVKVTIFQGCLTYLLFRFYYIHFLYMSTFLALMSAILPITPIWLSSIPAAVQLIMESRYLEAVLLTVIHLMLLDYGTAAIQDEIPGQNAYLTGLSILGGIALFPSVMEGAIMGPLLMTVMTALKNLYEEFFLHQVKPVQ